VYCQLATAKADHLALQAETIRYTNGDLRKLFGIELSMVPPYNSDMNGLQLLLKMSIEV
jgi:hypothetical protein